MKNYRNADLTGAYLRGADLQGADLQGADLTNTDLQNANLIDADLQHANLIDADLQYASLYRANLRDADLRSANLQYANLTNADLTNADLTNANLTNANLTNADLTNADLTNANLTNANLTNVDLTNAKHHSVTQAMPIRTHTPDGRRLYMVVKPQDYSEAIPFKDTEGELVNIKWFVISTMSNEFTTCPPTHPEEEYIIYAVEVDCVLQTTEHGTYVGNGMARILYEPSWAEIHACQHQQYTTTHESESYGGACRKCGEFDEYATVGKDGMVHCWRCS